MVADGSVRTIPINHGSARMPARAVPPVCLAQRAIPATKLLRHECHPVLTTTMLCVIERGWSRKFDDPIPLPMRGQLVSLEDAGTHNEAARSVVGQLHHFDLAPLTSGLLRLDIHRVIRHVSNVPTPIILTYYQFGPAASPVQGKH
jgi:hypothetical protein